MNQEVKNVNLILNTLTAPASTKKKLLVLGDNKALEAGVELNDDTKFIRGDGVLASIAGPAGTANYNAYFDGAGALSSEQFVALSRGGLGGNFVSEANATKLISVKADGTNYVAQLLLDENVHNNAAIARTKIALSTGVGKFLMNDLSTGLISDSEYLKVENNAMYVEGVNYLSSPWLVLDDGTGGGPISDSRALRYSLTGAQANANFTVLSYGTVAGKSYLIETEILAANQNNKNSYVKLKHLVKDVSNTVTAVLVDSQSKGDTEFDSLAWSVDVATPNSFKINVNFAQGGTVTCKACVLNKSVLVG